VSASHRFEDHTGEVELALEADTLPELFTQAALALAEILLGQPSAPPGPGAVTVRVSVRSADLPGLLVDWTNELIYRTEILGAVWSEVALLQLRDGELTAELRGIPASDLAVEVKAATLHDVRLEAVGHGWQGHLVLDV
jgi:SHS2 domain-containing protein